jgi:hypothetical protein
MSIVSVLVSDYKMVHSQDPEGHSRNIVCKMMALDFLDFMYTAIAWVVPVLLYDIVWAGEDSFIPVPYTVIHYSFTVGISLHNLPLRHIYDATAGDS